MARTYDCIRPNCDEKATFEKAIGIVDLSLERNPDGDFSVLTQGKICAKCTNDLTDFWMYGKK